MSIRNLCLWEQWNLCAWSEVDLDDPRWGAHLDHVAPKSRFPEKTFEHQNLLASAFDDSKQKITPRSQVFGGHYRLDRYSRNGFITPLRTDSRRYFHYSGDGRIEPALGLSDSERRKALYTIQILNLNAAVLITERKNWIGEFENVLDDLLQIPDPAQQKQALTKFMELELCETRHRLRPFQSAIYQRLGPHWQQAIRTRCPHCF